MIGGRCKVCGCTDMNCSNCVEKTGMPCWWINDSQDLCSACAEENSEDNDIIDWEEEEKEYDFEEHLKINFSLNKHFKSIKEEFFAIRERMKIHQYFNYADALSQFQMCVSIARIAQEQKHNFFKQVRNRYTFCSNS